MSVDNSAPSAAAGAEPAGSRAPPGTDGAQRRRWPLSTGPGHPYALWCWSQPSPTARRFLISAPGPAHAQPASGCARQPADRRHGGLGDPLTGGRVTLTGTRGRPAARRRCLGSWRAIPRRRSLRRLSRFLPCTRCEIAGGHYIGGFGRIVDLAPAELLTERRRRAELIAAEADIIDHMNSDHADAVALYATRTRQAPARGIGGCPASIRPAFDLLHRSNAVRIEFRKPVRTPGEARIALVALVQAARACADRRIGN